MDNITHSLIGVLLARGSLRWTRSLRGALWAAILASNVPDLDILAGPFFSDPKLGYLVHHRGYTHTLVAAGVWTVVCGAIARWRDPQARTGPIFALAAVAVLLHIGADGLNNYGIHPFWPVANTWMYGDTLFIAEPLLWVALLPVAWTTTRRRGVHVLLSAIGALLVIVSALVLGAVPAALLGAATVGLVLLQHRVDTLAVPITLSAAILLAFGLGRGAADAALRRADAVENPGDEVLDVVLTPRPATPWCWQGIVLARDTTTYVARGAAVSLLPGVTTPGGCSFRFGGEQTAPLVSDGRDAPPSVFWTAHFEAPAAELGALADESCRVRAADHFYRAPFWTADPARIVVGDLRYDLEAGLGFSEIESSRTGPPDRRGCGAMPPWRSAVVRDLLDMPG